MKREEHDMLILRYIFMCSYSRVVARASRVVPTRRSICGSYIT
jgi:hypothetical protein